MKNRLFGLFVATLLLIPLPSFAAANVCDINDVRNYDEVACNVLLADGIFECGANGRNYANAQCQAALVNRYGAGCDQSDRSYDSNTCRTAKSSTDQAAAAAIASTCDRNDRNYSARACSEAIANDASSACDQGDRNYDQRTCNSALAQKYGSACDSGDRNYTAETCMETARKANVQLAANAGDPNATPSQDLTDKGGHIGFRKVQ